MSDVTVSSPPSDESTGFILPGWSVIIIRWVLIVALPLVLILANAGLMMGEWFLRFEYNREGFPPDYYGFTTEERMLYGTMGLDYLFNDAGEEFLGDLTFDDGSPLFNQREVSHMTDVKGVTQGIAMFGYSLFAVYGLGLVLLAIKPATRPTLFRSLRTGSVVTIVLIIAGLVATALAFNWLFTAFHGLFFEGTTWIFNYSDTLIRLYPEQFWVDAFAFMFGGALLEALIIGGGMWWLLRRQAA